MLSDIVRFEWRYHTRQISFVAAVLLFFGFGFALTATGFGPDNVHIDSPYSIAQSIGMLSLLSLFALAAFCANAIVRDREHKFEEILFTTSVEKLPFLGGRFAGSFLAAFTAFSACVPGMLVARFMPWHDPARLGPLSLVPYLWALLVVALPNLLFAAMVMFALATITRSVLASYAGSVLIYVLYFVAAAMTNSPLMAASAPGANEGASLAPLLDPFALSAFFAQTEHWVPAMRNTRLLQLSGAFLANRVLFVSIAAAGFAALYRAFAFRVVSKSKKKKPLTRPLATLSPYLGRGVVGLLWAALVVSELVGEISGGEYGAAFHPTASLLFETIRTPLGLIATILLTYVSGEIVWRERALRFADILHATPASNAHFLLPKCFAAINIVLGLTGIAVIAGAAMQLAKGWPLEPLVLLQLAYYCAAPLVIFAVAAIVIHALTPHKYLGMLLVLLLGVVMLQGEQYGLRHPLLRFGATPPLAYSDFTGFGDTAQFHLLMLYWAALTGLLLLVAIRNWRHGKRERVSRPAVFALVAIVVATLPFLEVDLTDGRALRADYEKQYRQYAKLPLPRIAAVRARVDLGDGRRYHARGEYLLRNDTNAPIDTIFLSTRDRDHVVRTHLPPSASMTLRFDVHAEGDYDAYLDNVLPHLGYRATYELEDPHQRRRYGLPPKTSERAEHEIASGDWSAFDVTITTAGNIAVAPGALVRDWREDGRRLFRYRSDGHAPHRFAIVSADYAVTRATQGVPVEIYHHPKHTQNVARMMDAAASSLRELGATFGPYSQKHLRIAEVPVPNFSGYAYPGMILLGEKRGFLIDARDPRRLDLVARRTAHEIAHQWWGYTVIPANGPGASMLMESLTKYAELLVMEKMHGREAVRQSLAYELDRYLKDRTAERGTEPPLTRVDDQAYLYYRKGAIVLYALQDLIGRDRVNSALRDFMQEERGRGRTPTSAKLMQHLRAVTPPEHQQLLHDWFEDVVLYDFKLDSAKVRKVGNRYEVTMRMSSASNVPVDIGLFDIEDKPLSVTKHILRNGQQEVRVVVNKEPFIAAVDPYVLRIDRNRFDNTRRIEPSSP